MNKYKFLGLAGAVAVLTGAAHAAPVGSSFSSVAGTPFNAVSLNGLQALGDDLVGSKVTILFAGGGSGTANWLATAAGAGSASTGAWSLALSGDSFSSNWTLTNLGNTGITGFSFGGFPGNTVFDIVDSPATTSKSANDDAFGSADAAGGVTFAIPAYSNQLSIGGLFFGDLHTSMAVNSTSVLGSGGTFRFTADADNASAATGGITSGISKPAT